MTPFGGRATALVFTPDGPMNLRNEKFRTDPRPIVEIGMRLAH